MPNDNNNALKPVAHADNSLIFKRMYRIEANTTWITLINTICTAEMPSDVGKLRFKIGYDSTGNIVIRNEHVTDGEFIVPLLDVIQFLIANYGPEYFTANP